MLTKTPNTRLNGIANGASSLLGAALNGLRDWLNTIDNLAGKISRTFGGTLKILRSTFIDGLRTFSKSITENINIMNKPMLITTASTQLIILQILVNSPRSGFDGVLRILRLQSLLGINLLSGKNILNLCRINLSGNSFFSDFSLGFGLLAIRTDKRTSRNRASKIRKRAANIIIAMHFSTMAKSGTRRRPRRSNGARRHLRPSKTRRSSQKRIKTSILQAVNRPFSTILRITLLPIILKLFIPLIILLVKVKIFARIILIIKFALFLIIFPTFLIHGKALLLGLPIRPRRSTSRTSSNNAGKKQIIPTHHGKILQSRLLSMGGGGTHR